jgi:hypothetical protein
MLYRKGFFVWLAVTVGLLANRQSVAAQETGSANRSDKAGSFSPAPQWISASLYVARDTQAELSDFELMLVSQQTYTSGSKGATPTSMRICEMQNRTGGNMITTAYRAKGSHCDCKQFILNYGVGYDRGVAPVAVTDAEYSRVIRNCAESIGIYRR